jgi:cell wall-associated NlpC family hydrolase
MHAARLLVSLLALALMAGCQPAPDAPSDSDASPAAGPAQAVSLPDSALTPPDSATAARFEEAMAFARSQDLHERPVGAAMQALGMRFQGVPYRAGTLDAPPTERLVVHLDGFDCVTFVETLLAMARGVQQQDYSYAGFARRLAQQRYRTGTVGYCQRLHYFTDWIDANAKAGRVAPLTADLGGRVMRDTLDFMSRNRSSYAPMTDDSLYACVQQMEERLAAAQGGRPLRYIPQDSIQAVYDRLEAGDILAFATSIGGLDVAHTGLVYAGKDGQRGVLHASLSDGVTVSPDLQRYVQQIDHQIGIVVARPTVQAPTTASAGR